MDLMSLVDPVMTSPLLYPLLAVLSSMDGVLPFIPSEAAVLAAGVFARSGTPSLLLVVLATAAGVFIGDHFAYGLSRSAAGPRLLGRSPRVGRAIAAAGRQLEGRAGLLIVMSRFMPGGRVTMNVAAGTTGVPLSRFSPASAIAALAWAAYVAGLGVLGGAAFVENPLLGLAVGLGLSFLLGGVVELVRRRLTPGTARPAGAGKRKLRALVAATTAAAVLIAPAAAGAARADEDRAGRQRRLDTVAAAGTVAAPSLRRQLPDIGAFVDVERDTVRVL
ncbi:DedA family protein [Micromonospora ureilytica]|uniref:DedA family protein n=1 Tax=Micromonospora ureilytica TaxID=709868 RepID=UPI00403A0252